jgi:hypothetical protein
MTGILLSHRASLPALNYPMYSASEDDIAIVVWRFEVHKIVQSFLQDITNKIPVTIFGGNQAEITLSKDPISHSKSKHMDIKFHWQREQLEKNEITYPQVKTSLISTTERSIY